MTDRPRLSKSARTRARIAEAAGHAFSETGFAATSVRDIAQRAGCDPALIIRYFGSKEALFSEVGQFDLNLPDLSGLTPEQAANRLAGHFVSVWEAPDTGERFQILLRSAAAHEPSADRLRAVFTGQVVAMVAGYRGGTRGARAQAAMLASVILGAALTRYVLRLPHLADLPAPRLARAIALSLEPIFQDSPQPQDPKP